jgi:hypothetical protein
VRGSPHQRLDIPDAGRCNSALWGLFVFFSLDSLTFFTSGASYIIQPICNSSHHTLTCMHDKAPFFLSLCWLAHTVFTYIRTNTNNTCAYSPNARMQRRAAPACCMRTTVCACVKKKLCLRALGLDAHLSIIKTMWVVVLCLVKSCVCGRGRKRFWKSGVPRIGLSTTLLFVPRLPPPRSPPPLAPFPRPRFVFPITPPSLSSPSPTFVLLGPREGRGGDKVAVVAVVSLPVD